MFREMRRKKQALSVEDTIKVLTKGTSGVLALSGDDGYPYAVPMSYVYCDSKIFFHCAQTGHKIDAIKNNHKASFCVIDEDTIVPEEYTTYFRSVIVFGKMRILQEPTEKRKALEVLAAKYSPDQVQGREEEIEGSFDRVGVLELCIEYMSGKEAIELVKQDI